MIFPVPAHDGHMPVVSSSYHSHSRPDHHGVDIMYRRPKRGLQELPVYSRNYFMPNGIPALATHAGTVRRSGEIGTGGIIEVDHPDGLRTQYMHLRRRRVKAGDKVRPGQQIADVSHNPTGYRLNHLHFQMRRNGKLIDPEPLLRAAKVVSGPVRFPIVGIAASVGVGYLMYRYLFV